MYQALRVGDWSLLLDQRNRLLCGHPLGDQDACPHRHAPMPALRAVRIHHTSSLNHLERFPYTLLQEADGDGENG